MARAKLRFKTIFFAFVLTLCCATQVGCATGETKKIIIGMVGGATVGAATGYEFVRAGEQHKYRTQNTIISAAVGALLVGGFLAWHYDQLKDQSVAISGEYARYRLCNPDEMPPEMVRKMGLGTTEVSSAAPVQQTQVGKLAISLDDNTKWAYPVFRKRFLQPERGENQVVSDRYIWEILKPGNFVTRSQDPQFFLESKDEKHEK